jgi:hypothetical protein
VSGDSLADWPVYFESCRFIELVEENQNSVKAVIAGCRPTMWENCSPVNLERLEVFRHPWTHRRLAYQRGLIWG